MSLSKPAPKKLVFKTSSNTPLLQRRPPNPSLPPPSSVVDDSDDSDDSNVEILSKKPPPAVRKPEPSYPPVRTDISLFASSDNPIQPRSIPSSRPVQPLQFKKVQRPQTQPQPQAKPVAPAPTPVVMPPLSVYMDFIPTSVLEEFVNKSIANNPVAAGSLGMWGGEESVPWDVNEKVLSILHSEPFRSCELAFAQKMGMSVDEVDQLCFAALGMLFSTSSDTRQEGVETLKRMGSRITPGVEELATLLSQLSTK